MLFKRHIALLLIVLLHLNVSSAATYPLPTSGEVVGTIKEGVARSGETLIEVGRRYDIGYREMLTANPDIEPSKRLFSGTKVVIPSKFILPPGPREGMIINLAELRLYYYPSERGVVVTQPVGIGREGNWKTPVGVTKITTKVQNPYWYPTANVRAEAAKNGTPIPRIFPPGPANPLGEFSLRLGWPTYLIHGTNRPEGVGARVSAGCIRMLPEDVEYLYENVPIGTKVTVINEPYKVGWQQGRLYFEAHPLLEESKPRYEEDLAQVVALIQEKIKGNNAIVRWTEVKKLTNHYSITPQLIGAKSTYTE